MILEKNKKWGEFIKMIIERNEEEYMKDMENIYYNEIKPLLDKGYSLTKAFKTIGVATGRSARKSKELRKLAVNDGYKMRR